MHLEYVVVVTHILVKQLLRIALGNTRRNAIPLRNANFLKIVYSREIFH